MQKTLKRTLSLVLTVLMVTALFTVAPLSVGAAETDAEAVGAEPVIVPGQTVNAEITTGGEIAYIKFVPTKDMKIIVYSSSNVDTYGYFYDSQKNELDYNDDGGDNSNFKLTENVTANTTYYIGAKFYSRKKTGTIPVTLIEDKPKTVRFYDDEKLLGSIPYDEDTFYSYSTLSDSDYPALFLADTDEKIFKGYQKSSGTICYSKSSDYLSYQWNISTSDFDADGYLNLYSSWEEAYTINFYNGETRIGSAKVESSQIADYFSVDDSFVLENANGKVFKGYKKDGDDTLCITLSYGSLYYSSGTLSTEDFDANKTLNVYAVWEDGYTLSFYNGETFLCDYIVESPDSIGWSIDCNSYSPASTDSAFLSDGDGKVFKGYKKNGSDTLCFSIFRGMHGTSLNYTSNSITADDFDTNRTLRLDAEWVEGYTVEFYNDETKVGEHVFESIETIDDIYKTSENGNIFLSNGNGSIFTGYENNGTACFELSSNYGVSNLAYQSGTITETDFTDRKMRVTATFNTNVCKFTAYSLSIEGDTSLIFMVDTSRTTYESNIYPNVSVTYGDQVHGDWDYHYWQLDDNTMKIKVELAAKLMSADVTITMPDKSCCTYSIRQYAEKILSGNYDGYLSQTYGYSAEKITALKSLLKSMLNFGSKAQVQFDCATDDLANKNLAQYNGGVEYTAPVVNPANLTSLSYTDSQFDNVGLVYAGSSLGLFEKFRYCVAFEDTKGPCLNNSEGEGREFGEESQSFPRFSLPDKFKDTWEGLESAKYLTTTDGSIYHVMDPNAANYGNYYLYFKTKAIYPQNFDEDVVINISRTAKNDAVYTNSITINPVTYIKRALETTDTTTAAGRTLVDTVTAVYDYCTNAKAFFARNIGGY